MSNPPILAGVVGWPVTYSLSPVIHSTWAHRAGINGYYVPVAVPPSEDEFRQIINGLRRVRFAGVNVTKPHKENALRLADEASEIAKKAGAANMLTFQKDHIYADNSDVVGFANAVKEQSTNPGIHGLVLGAGGAARGIILALQSLGLKKITITNRTREKAEALADEFSLDVVDWDRRSNNLDTADILVNTTSLGMTGQPSLEIDLNTLKPKSIVADIVYSPLETPLLKAASSQHTIDGLSMLMHQAVPGFKQWFGGTGIVDAALKQTLLTEIKRRETA
ncbi:shikimate dehydrogenase [Hyphococcus lacteus]|uniref:Shikimate dehydrogenase (NADP(+)) n=1 Tax=Hyphococcus lacteus TaxID=3143536 RepID=A0ABV3Z1R6_9PROT